jgi:ABC-2 type transport system permease protein
MLVAAGLTAALVVPSAVLTGLLAGGTGPALGTTFGFAVAAAVGGTAYACAFVGLSAFTSRALVIGLAYTMIWEGVLAGLLEGTRFLSIRQATLGIANGISTPPAAFVAAGDTGSLDPGLSVVIIMVAVVAAFVLGSIRLARFEVRGAD